MSVQGSNMAGYAAETRDFMPKAGYGPATNGSIEQVHIPQMIEMLTKEAATLLEELSELHQRLSPVMQERPKDDNFKRPSPPAASRMSGDLANAYSLVESARQATRAILTQLDL